MDHVKGKKCGAAHSWTKSYPAVILGFCFASLVPDGKNALEEPTNGVTRPAK